MDLLDRLDKLMEKHHEKPVDLARNAGIPSTTVYGLYQKGYKNAKITTISKICDHYGVTLDYLIKGSDGVSNEAIIVAAKYDKLDEHSKELIELVIDHESRRAHTDESKNSIAPETPKSPEDMPTAGEELARQEEIQAAHPDLALGE